MSSSAPPDLLKIIALLADSGADFVIIGGIAIQVHGSDHLTSDVDFAYNRQRENAKLIAGALAGIHPKPTNWPEGVPFVWDDQTIMNCTVLTLDTDFGRVDLLGQPDGAPPYQQLRERAIDITWEGRPLTVASIDDLISMKRAAGRPKDLAHIAELETIKRLLAEEG